jgi:hypothetical protein
LIRSFSLREGKKVAVCVHRQAKLRVPERFHDDSRVHSAGKKERRARMAQIVEALSGQTGVAKDTLECLGHIRRVERRSNGGREHCV